MSFLVEPIQNFVQKFTDIWLIYSHRILHHPPLIGYTHTSMPLFANKNVISFSVRCQI